MLEKAFLSFIETQIDDSYPKRLVIQDIPSFIQRKLFLYLKDTESLSFPILFTEVNESNINPRIYLATKKEDILSLRNNSAIGNLVIITSSPLDRSNETSVVALNELPENKWQWLNLELGQYLLNSIFADFDIKEKDNRDLTLKVLLHVGQYYDGGIKKQWQLLDRLFNLCATHKLTSEEERLSLALCLPAPGKDRFLGHSLASLDSRLNFKKEDIGNAITGAIEKMGLLGFKEYVLGRIFDLANNPGSEEFDRLYSVILVNNYDNDQSKFFEMTYKNAFDKYFNNLTSNSLRALDICNSPLFYFIGDINNTACPDWWPLLTSEFWTIFLNPNKKSNDKLIVDVLNKIPTYDNSFSKVILTTNRKLGRIDFQVKDYGAIVGDLSLTVPGYSKMQVSSAHFSFDLTSSIEKPLPFVFQSTTTNKLTLKILPIENFSGGIIPFNKNAGSKNYIPSKKNDKWISEIEISTRGQSKLFFLVNENLESSNLVLIDLEDNISIPIRQAPHETLEGLTLYESIIWIEGETSEKVFKLDYLGLEREKCELIINIKVEGKQLDEVDSVFRKLVKEHITKKASTVNFSSKDNFLDLFESWVVSNSDISHRPVLLSVEKIENQLTQGLGVDQNGWHSLIDGISAQNFMLKEYSLSNELLQCRSKIFQYLSVVSSQPFDSVKLLRSMDFLFEDHLENLIIDYLQAYEREITSNENSQAKWMDLHPIVYDKGLSTELISSKDIIGLVVSPYHPLRLYWQLRAQQELNNTLRGIKDDYRFNPAASALDPSIVPDLLVLETRSTLGESNIMRFISHTNDSDYWGILLNPVSSPYIVNTDNNLERFWNRLGIRVEGLNQGLFASQIERSLKDVSRLLVTHDSLRVALHGNSKGYEEEGIFSWLKNVTNLNNDNNKSYLQEYVWAKVRPKTLEIYDKRSEVVQPNEYQLLDEYLQSDQNFKWFNVSDDSSNSLVTDLSILCNVGLNSIEFAQSKEEASPCIGPLLYKHRLVKVIPNQAQVPLKEQRKTNTGFIKRKQADTSFANIVGLLEDAGEDLNTALAISPRIDLLSRALNTSHLSVVSSSLVSPATFSLLSQRGAAGELYLWDFDLPSFTSSSNSKNGFYLLAHPRLGTQTSAIKSSFSKYLNRFSQYQALSKDEKEKITSLLLSEYIRKGLPSLKKLVYGGNAFRGEIGNLIALRLLQGHDGLGGILPIIQNENTLNLIIPVDPFQDIIEKMPKDQDDDRSRPDLLVISFKKCDEFNRIKITPIEVKYRTNKDPEWELKIIQATKFSKFLEKVYTLGNCWELWKVAFCSIVGRMVEYGLNISATQFKDNQIVSRVYELGFSLLNELFNTTGKSEVEFDTNGRLIYINVNPDDNDLNNVNSNEIEIISNCAYINHNISQEILFNEDGAKNVVLRSKKLNNSTWSLVPVCSGSLSVKENTPIGDEIVENKPNEDIYQEAQTIAPVTTEDVSTLIENPIDEYLFEYPFGLKFTVGKTTNRFGSVDYYFNPGSTEVNQLNIGVIGDLGTGKTQLLKSIVYEMSKNPVANRGVSPKFLILDTKRDYDGSGSELDKKFLNEIKAEVLEPYKLRLNIFNIRGATEINPALSKAKFFIDVLTKIYGGIGPVQKDQLLEAILTAYKNNGYVSGVGVNYDNFISPTLKDIRDIYRERVKQTDAPLSIMNTLVLEELFEEDASKTLPFNDLFSKTIVVALGKIASSSDSLKLAMVIFLKLYQDYMLSIEKAPFVGSNPSLRKVDSFILIDEAKLIMDYDFQVLEDLLRKGREFGVGVILSTQYLSDFTGGKIDYKQPLSTWFIHKVPNINVKELKSIGLSDSNEQIITEIQALQKHYCLYKTVDVNGKVIRGIPLYEILK